MNSIDKYSKIRAERRVGPPFAVVKNLVTLVFVLQQLAPTPFGDFEKPSENFEAV